MRERERASMGREIERKRSFARQGREIELLRGKRGLLQGKREIELPWDKARTKGEQLLAALFLAGLCVAMGGRVPFCR